MRFFYTNYKSNVIAHRHLTKQGSRIFACLTYAGAGLTETDRRPASFTETKPADVDPNILVSRNYSTPRQSSAAQTNVVVCERATEF